ncbi:MAG: hypothetical protein EBQ92_00625, partial [Proteobacteria bacterium]|nr:hypothetical protein [Pseudomonadota bacterium]
KQQQKHQRAKEEQKRKNMMKAQYAKQLQKYRQEDAEKQSESGSTSKVSVPQVRLPQLIAVGFDIQIDREAVRIAIAEVFPNGSMIRMTPDADRIEFQIGNYNILDSQKSGVLYSKNAIKCGLDVEGTDEELRDWYKKRSKIENTEVIIKSIWLTPNNLVANAYAVDDGSRRFFVFLTEASSTTIIKRQIVGGKYGVEVELFTPLKFNAKPYMYEK